MGVKLLGKIKIHEIAKEIGLASKEVVERAQKLGIDVTSHMSSVDDVQAKKIKDSFDSKTKSSENKNSKQITKSKEATPVIIRRAVIISEEEEKTVEETRNKKEEHRKGVGFVERNNNKDYNIVYRNKQTKPMTVNELFGIKPKEEKKVEKVQEVTPNEDVTIKEAPKVEEIKKEVVKKTAEENVNYQNKNNNFTAQREKNNYQDRNNYRDNRNMDNNRNNIFLILHHYHFLFYRLNLQILYFQLRL